MLYCDLRRLLCIKRGRDEKDSNDSGFSTTRISERNCR